MKLKRTIATVLLGALMLSLLAACGKTPPPATSSGSSESSAVDSGAVTAPDVPTDEGYGILREAEIDKIASLNPLTYTVSYSSRQLKRASMILYDYFPNAAFDFVELTGEFALEDPISQNAENTIWHIKLREGVIWENGEVMNADDVMYTWQMMLDPKLVNIRASNFAKDVIEIENAMAYLKGTATWDEVGLKKVDDLTVEITTVNGHDAKEVMTHLSHPANCIINEELFEKCMNADRTENTYGTTFDKWISSGPFLVTSWVNDAEINFKKNPNYVFKDIIWLAGIQTKVVSDENTRMQLFESDSVDYVKLQTANYLKYEEDPRVITAPVNAVRHLAVNSANPDKPILANEKFRKALYYAINREELAKLTKQSPAAYIVPTTHIVDLESGTAFRDTAEGKANVPENNGYDPEKAKALFEEALAEVGISNVTLTILYADSELMKMMTEYVQQNVPEVLGADKIKFELQAMPTAQLSAHRNSWPTTPNVYDLSWAGWISSDLAPWSAFKYWTTYYSNKNEPFFSEEFDKAFNDANFDPGRFEPGKRLELMDKMEDLILDPAILIPATQDIDKFIKSDKVKLALGGWANRIEFGWTYSRILEN